MSQQLNLLSKDMVADRDWLDFRVTSLACLLLFIIMLIPYGWSTFNVITLSAQESDISQQLAELQAQLNEEIAKRAPKEPDPTLLMEIQRAEATLNYRQQVLRFLQNSKFVRSQGISRYMEAFARQSRSDMWLTGFVLDDSTGMVEIRGNIQSPQLLTDYIRDMQQESVFAGRSFSTLEVSGTLLSADTLSLLLNGQPDQPLDDTLDISMINVPSSAFSTEQAQIGNFILRSQVSQQEKSDLVTAVPSVEQNNGQ